MTPSIAKTAVIHACPAAPETSQTCRHSASHALLLMNPHSKVLLMPDQEGTSEVIHKVAQLCGRCRGKHGAACSFVHHGSMSEGEATSLAMLTQAANHDTDDNIVVMRYSTHRQSLRTSRRTNSTGPTNVQYGDSYCRRHFSSLWYVCLDQRFFIACALHIIEERGLRFGDCAGLHLLASANAAPASLFYIRGGMDCLSLRS